MTCISSNSRGPGRLSRRYACCGRRRSRDMPRRQGYGARQSRRDHASLCAPQLDEREEAIYYLHPPGQGGVWGWGGAARPDRIIVLATLTLTDVRVPCACRRVLRAEAGARGRVRGTTTTGPANGQAQTMRDARRCGDRTTTLHSTVARANAWTS